MKNSFKANRKLIAALVEKSSRVVFSSGYTLFRQGEVPSGVYVVCEGNASLVMKSESGAVLLSLEVPAGSLLGLPGIVANECYTFSAFALPGSDIRFVNREDFEGLIQSEPSLNPMVLEVLAAEVRSARNALSGLLGKLSTRGSSVTQGTSR
jgi:CRP-like cAMP-binding protein